MSRSMTLPTLASGAQRKRTVPYKKQSKLYQVTLVMCAPCHRDVQHHAGVDVDDQYIAISASETLNSPWNATFE
jgi:hypothetical protein